LNVLENFQVPEFLTLLDKALSVTTARTEDDPLVDAITTRLIFRKTFLEIVSNTATSSEDRTKALEKCQNLLPRITETIVLGKEMKGVFSTRIQRKLSIQVPPRPMVAIDPKEAAKSMKALLDGLVEIERVREYISPHEIIVRPPDYLT
jgi:hypothetical protein